MSKWIARSLSLIAIVLLVACGGAAEQAQPTIEAPPAAASPAADAADLAAVKAYTLDNAHQMKEGTAALAATATLAVTVTSFAGRTTAAFGGACFRRAFAAFTTAGTAFGGAIAAKYMLSQPADGQTLLMIASRRADGGSARAQRRLRSAA